jgi:hypothetical protein
MIQTFQQYAAAKGIKEQAISQMKKLTVIDLPTFVEYDGERLEVGKRKIIITDNQQVTK